MNENMYAEITGIPAGFKWCGQPIRNRSCRMKSSLTMPTITMPAPGKSNSSPDSALHMPVTSVTGWRAEKAPFPAPATFGNRRGWSYV